MRNFSKKRANCHFFGFLWGIVFSNLLILACSAPAVNMKCAELQFRLNQKDLGEDEKRVLGEELNNCRQQVGEAKQQDSLTIKKLKKPFSSEEDSL